MENRHRLVKTCFCHKQKCCQFDVLRQWRHLKPVSSQRNTYQSMQLESLTNGHLTAECLYLVMDGVEVGDQTC